MNRGSRWSVLAGVLAITTSLVSRASQPCPPPSVNVTDGSSASTACAAAASYSTNFAATQNPLAEGGKWTNGKAVGLDWNNVQSVPGKAFAAAIVTGYNDDIAILNTAFAADQYAQGTVSRVAGYAPGTNHEIELLLRFQITPKNARGYEVLWGQAGEFAIVRWNGPLSDYTPLLDNGNIGVAVEGDVLRAEIGSNVIRVYKNGSLVGSVNVAAFGGSVWNSGQPGIGFWPRAGATIQNYGWKSYQAGDM